MRNRKLGLTLTILGFIIAISGIVLDNPELSSSTNSIIKYIGVSLLAIGAIINYLASSDYTQEFESTDWKVIGNEKYILIPYKKHLKSNPIVQVFEKDKLGFSEVGVNNIIQKNRDVKMRINGSGFNGKVTIK